MIDSSFRNLRTEHSQTTAELLDEPLLHFYQNKAIMMLFFLKKKKKTNIQEWFAKNFTETGAQVK
jgi:hypothetical protein